jgi:hypothetical protein
MTADTSIAVMLFDKFSPTLKALSNNTKAFDKDMQRLEETCAAYEKTQESLIKDITTLKSKLVESNDKVRDATKAWKANKDELTKGMLDKAIKEQTEYENKLNDTEMALKSQRKAVLGLAGDIRKAGNQDGFGTMAGLTKGLFQTEIGKMFSESLGGAASAALSSSIGEPAARFMSGALSGVISGATMGMKLGPKGAVVGGLLGGLSGVVSGATQIGQAKDDAFKTYVQESFDTVTGERAADIAGGSSIAAGREQKQLAFSTLLGSDEAAAGFLSNVKDMAAQTNYTYDEITGYAKSLVKPFGTEKSLDILTKLSDTSAALSLNESDNSVLIAGLTRMKLTDKTTMEYLNYFSERGIDVYAALSKWGDAAQVAKKVSSGKIKGSEAVEEILNYLEEQYGGLSERMAGTYEGMLGNLEDARANAQEAYGIGYNEARKEGLAAETAWQNSGEMDEINQAMGAWQASLENSKEQFIREAQQVVLETEEYKAAMAAGTDEGYAEAGRMLMEAKVRGMNEYNASEGAQLALESERALAANIREDTAGNQDYWDAGYEKGQWFTKGLASALRFGGEGITTEDVTEVLKEGDIQKSIELLGGQGYAYGLERVPYDNFPALLHQGERVLTAAQARAQDRAGGGGIIVNMSGVTIREEADIDKLARAFVAQAQRAALLSAPA